MEEIEHCTKGIDKTFLIHVLESLDSITFENQSNQKRTPCSVSLSVQDMNIKQILIVLFIVIQYDFPQAILYNYNYQ